MQTHYVRKHFFVPGTKPEYCPRCGQKTFVPYINIETGNPIDKTKFGYCNRRKKCHYDCSPTYEDYKSLGLLTETPVEVSPKIKRRLYETLDEAFDVIPNIDFIKSITQPYNKQDLFRFLCTKFPESKVREVFQRYCIGYSTDWGGSTVYWQIDSNGNIRTGKAMGYDPETGKRRKVPFAQVSWMHSLDSKMKEMNIEPTFIMKQCLFGEHLMSQYRRYRVVEGEKTAVICSIFSKDPTELWLSVGGIQNLGIRVLTPLEGKEVIFYPDKGQAAKDWEDKLSQLPKEIGSKFKINTCLESTTLEEGEDLSDYILKEI